MIVTKRNAFSRIEVGSRLLAAILTFALAPQFVAIVAAQGQTFQPSYQPRQRHLIRGDMAPGVAADFSRMANPKLEGYVQPVRVIGPIGARVEVGSQQGYISTNSSRVSVGLTVGPVYRFKITNIPRYPGKELYPSVELLNRLSPPEGLKNEFPIQIVISQDDLEQALQSRMVTKVIYLENPETALPHRHSEGQQPYFDVGGAEDPLRAAEKLGRPMAILRIGSRIPLATDSHEFGFYAPSPTVLPDPQPIQQKTDGLDPIPPIRNTAPTIPGMLMPIPTVRGNGQ